MPGNYSTDFAFVDAQLDEMTKIAIGTAGIGRLVGAGLGAGVGGATGYVTAAPDQKLQGAVKGGLVGGIAGLAGGQAATKAGRKEVVQFGQRQLHGATGYLPGRGITGGKLGPIHGENRVKALKDIGWTVPDAQAKDTGTAIKNLKSRIAKTRAEGKPTIGGRTLAQRFADTKAGKKWENSSIRDFLLKRKVQTNRYRRQLAEEGFTSLPGLVKGYATGVGVSGKNIGRLNVAKANLLAPGVVMGVGLPAAFAVPGVVESVQTGDVRPAARSLMEGAGYAIGGGLPMAATMGVGSAVSAATGRLLGAPKQPQAIPASRYQRAAQQYGAPLGQVVS